ncbi:MAG: twin arginine translocase protein [Planctomycetota bacterium]|nr:twin arginine translocase protein [Planctomycetota bacterium]
MSLLAFLPTMHGPEILIVGFVALLIFGNRLPGVMRSLGKSVTEFKKGVSGIEEDIDTAAAVPEKKVTKTTPEV